MLVSANKIQNKIFKALFYSNIGLVQNKPSLHIQIMNSNEKSIIRFESDYLDSEN